MQETTPEGVVYSKIDYDDGDEEVLNLANEICECLDEARTAWCIVPDRVRDAGWTVARPDD